jgi:hypothetical protein
VIRLGTNKIQCSRSTIVKVASGRAIHSVGSHTAEAESAGLAGGASRIRTRGPTLSTQPTDNGGHGRRAPRLGTSERQEHLDAPALRQKGRLQQAHRMFLIAAAANGTEGSNPACFSVESGSPCEIVHGETARSPSQKAPLE